MKKGILCLFIGSVLLCPYSKLSAQGFLKKIAKGIENVSKELDKATDKLSGAEQVTINNASITYSTPSGLLKVDIDKVEMHGDDLYLEFILTNQSDTDIKSYALTSDFSKEHIKTYAVDNLGGRATVIVTLVGTDPSSDRPSPRTKIPRDLPLRAIVKIGEINPKATSITQLRIEGHDWSSSARKELNGGFVFKNIPIVRQQETSAVLPSKPVAMSININDKEPCDGSVFVLTITGGTPFAGDVPFKVETKKISGDDGKIYPGKFKQGLDGKYTIEIGTSVSSMESKQQLIVTDKAGNNKSIDYTIYNCP